MSQTTPPLTREEALTKANEMNMKQLVVVDPHLFVVHRIGRSEPFMYEIRRYHRTAGAWQYLSTVKTE